MFTRRDNSAAARAPLADIKPVDKHFETSGGATPLRPEERSVDAFPTPPPIKPVSTAATPPLASFNAGSIIGNDLTIMGQGLRIVTRGTLQVDGCIEGDVVGQEVIIGERGQVTGVVSGETVVVRGGVSGTVKAMTVILQSGAKVEGDIHHHQLTVEQGAHLDGRVRRPQDTSELKPEIMPVDVHKD